MQKAITILVVLLSLACSIISKNDQVIIDAPTPTNTVAHPFGEAETFTAGEECFAFDYPAGWEIVDVSAGQTPLTGSYVVVSLYNYLTEGSNLRPDQIKFDFMIHATTDIQALADEDEGGQGFTAKTRTEVVLPTGLSGIQMQGTDYFNAELTILYLIIGERGLEIGGYADDTTFSAIVNTIRLVC